MVKYHSFRPIDDFMMRFLNTNERFPYRALHSFLLLLCLSPIFAAEVPIEDFLIQPYSQQTGDYISPDSPDYSTPLLKPGYQAAQMHQFYLHYYSSDSNGLSPWSEAMVRAVLPVVKDTEIKILDAFNHQNQSASGRHYGGNFKPHDEVWLNQMKQNMDFNAIESSEFKENNRAIAIANTFARLLPDQSPDFHHFTLPGEGFPFDQLQDSAIWAGTPLYVLSVSTDKAWSLVLTPDGYFSWVKSSDIAYASDAFIHHWQAAAQRGLIAITETGTSILNPQGHFQLTGYMGSVYPFAGKDENNTKIYIPSKNDNQQAVMKIGVIRTNAAGLMPMLASKENMVKLINQLKNRPYGWGGAYFFNDCSQELKSLFTPLGIWLPRNSGQQGKLSSSIDLKDKPLKERITALKTTGHPLMTLIYIGGHVMLYMGNHESDVITYQNVWGLAPASKDKRYIIGQSVFLPLLPYFPGYPEIASQADKSLFTLVHLDELDVKGETPEMFVKHWMS